MGDTEEIKEVPPSGAKDAASTASTIAKPEPSSAAPKATEPVTDKEVSQKPQLVSPWAQIVKSAPKTAPPARSTPQPAAASTKAGTASASSANTSSTDADTPSYAKASVKAPASSKPGAEKPAEAKPPSYAKAAVAPPTKKVSVDAKDEAPASASSEKTPKFSTPEVSKAPQEPADKKVTDKVERKPVEGSWKKADKQSEDGAASPQEEKGEAADAKPSKPAWGKLPSGVPSTKPDRKSVV